MAMFKMMMRLASLGLLLFISGCAEIPIKDGGLAIGKDTTATMDDFGVGRVDSKF
jgi:hypothetical protein